MDEAGCSSPVPDTPAEAMSSREANTSIQKANEDDVLPYDGARSEVPSRSQEEWTFKKTAGSADMAGELFEVKSLALIFLQALRMTGDFSIANNMSAAGLFDDIIYVDNVNRTAYFIQLNHRGSAKTFGGPMLTSATGKFGLIKYLHTYRKVKVNYAEGDKELLHCGPFENIKFVFFTNSRIQNCVYDDDEEVNRDGDLFKTGGKTFRLKVDGKISQELKAMDQELSDLKQLLQKLQCDIKDIKDVNGVSKIIKDRVTDRLVSKNQVISEKVTQLIANPCEKELTSLLSWEEFDDVRDDVTRDEFISKLLLCSDQPNETDLDEKIKDEIRSVWLTSASEVDGVSEGVVDGVQTWWRQRGKVKVLTAKSRIWTNALHRRTREYLQSHGISFVKTCTECLWKRVRSFQSLIVAVLIKGDIPTLTSIKMLRPMETSGNTLDGIIFVSLDVLSKEKDKVLAAWNTVWCKVLVVECGSDLDPVAAHKLGEDLVEIAERLQKKVVLITTREHALIKATKRLTLSYDEFEDDTRWENLDKDSQKVVRSKVVNFQGEHMRLGEVVGERQELLSKIDAVTLGLLLKPDKLQVGKCLDDHMGVYVPRRLGGDDEPVRALSDDGDKVVLITGPPGMGKSTLLTELAKVTKRRDPALWVARLNLADCSQYLQELDSKDIVDGFEILRKFTFDCGTTFEEALFTHCLREGKIVILLDGVDEVIRYIHGVLTILEKLHKSKISALWVTSRSVVQTQIEGTLDIEAKELVPFTELDQCNFLTEFWKSRHPDVDTLNLKEFVDALLKLANNSLYEHGNTFTGVPQLIGMLAEIYEPDFKKYTEFSVSLPNTLDLTRLYAGFVERKHESYFRDKKKLDPMQAAIPANKEDKEKNFRYFLRNHMKAAVHLYFDQDDHEQLGIGSEIKMNLEEFFEDIRNGIEKTGIIDGMTPSGQPRFVHRTFVDYFVALWITENYINIRSFYMNRTLDSNLKQLIDGIFAHNCPLHKSTLMRDVIEVRRLLETETKIVDKTDSGLRTPLHLVALTYEHSHRRTDVAIARLLFEHSPSVGVTDDVYGMRPLQLADRAQAWPIAGLILRHGGDASDMDTTRDLTGEDFEGLVDFLREPNENVVIHLLEVAAKHGVVSLLRYLVDEHSGPIDAPGNLMRLAAIGGHVEVMTYLNAKGVSWSSTDGEGNAPLHHASKGGSKVAIEFLLDHGCDVNVRNDALATPLIVAAGSVAAGLDVVVFLVDRGADVNACDREGVSALRYSVTLEKLDVVKYLLEKGGVDVGGFDVGELWRRIEEAERKEKSPGKETNVRHAMPSSLPGDMGSDKYDMEHKRRGHAVIFKHEHFQEPSYGTRAGSSVDMEAARNTFQRLGFTVSVHIDLRLAQIKQVVKQLRDEDHSDADCLAMVILSHGKEDSLVMAYDTMYSTDYLWQSFKPEICPSLAGKPKLFFIQGCRGEMVDNATQTVSQTRYSPFSTRAQGHLVATDGVPYYEEQDRSVQQRIPAAADVLIANSTVNGYVSFRNTTRGGWFIQSLCHELSEGSATTDLMKMLTRTARRVALLYEAHSISNHFRGAKQVPATLSMLTKEVYFTPKDEAVD